MTDSGALSALPGRRFTAEEIVSRTWTFGRAEAPPYARHVRLLPGGRIAGHQGAMEQSWRLEDGVLVLFDWVHRRSTIFDQVFVGADGRLSLVGEYLHPPGLAWHRLQEIAPLSTLKADRGDLDLIHRPAGRPRRNLVVVRANEQSIHPEWPRNIGDPDRTWDLCVSFYGAPENFGSWGFEEWRVLQNDQRKGPALHDLFYEGSPLWGYDYIAVIDDDMMMSWSDINEIFGFCDRFDLLMAQPALAGHSHSNYPMFLQNPDYLLRYVSFVEFMATFFARDAWRRLAPTLKGVISGYGIDNVWPKLLGEPMNAIAVIDKLPAVHTRPLAGGRYDIDEAIAEGNALQHAYDAPSRVLEFGGIFAEPINRQHAW